MTIPPASAAMGETPHLERQLSNRHIQLAIGRAIGTGLFADARHDAEARGNSATVEAS